MISVPERGDGNQLVVGLHFLGADASTTDQVLFDGLDGDYRFVFPSGEHSIEGDVSWFPDGYYEMSAQDQNSVVRSVVAGLADLIADRSPGGAIVVGASQGGDLAAALAILQPGSVQLAMAVAANPPLLPVSPSPPPLHLFHGVDDGIVPVESARMLSARHGVALNEYAGVGHAVPALMRRDIHSQIASVTMTRESG